MIHFAGRLQDGGPERGIGMAKITREALTKKTVDAAKATGSLYRLRDSTVPGLLLRVNATGKRTWAITWGRGQERIIGTYPVMTLEAARDEARSQLGEVAEHGAPLAVIEANKPASEKPITLGDFISEHFAPWAKAHQKAGQATVDALKACFGNLYARELRGVMARDIEQFKTKRLNAKIKPATINRDLDRIRKVFSCAVEWGFVAQHPMADKKVKRIKVDNERVRYLTPAEDRRLREAIAKREAERRSSRESGNKWCEQRGGEGRPMWPKDGYTDHVAPMVLLALNTGMRRGELFGLDWRSVNIPAKLVTVEAGNAKTGKTRHIPLNAEALSVLKHWKKQHGGEGLVFPNASGGRFDNINKAWAGLTDAAQLPEFHFHDCRHDFASKLVMAGVDLNTVRELLGHADIKMTLRYAHLAPGKLADAVALLGAKK